MDNIDNPAFNDQIAETLATQGHPYIAVALVILQIAIIPLVLFVFKWYSSRAIAIAEDKKKIVDLKRAVTAQKRDAQYVELKNEDKAIEVRLGNRIDHIENAAMHRDEEISTKLTILEKMLNRMFDKMDNIEDDYISKRKQG